MSKEVAKKADGTVAEYKGSPEAGQALASDVIIPKVLIMQGLSELVAERKAQMGDIVRSTTGEKLGDDKNPVEFIPLAMKNSWLIQEKVGGKFEYRRSVPRTGMAEAADKNRPDPDKQSETLPWDFKFNGTDWKRVKSIDVYALLPGDVAGFKAEFDAAKKEGRLPDLEKVIMPVVISFRSTGYTAGKAVATHFERARAMNVPAFGYATSLECYVDKNDKGTYYVPKIGKNRTCTKEEFAEAVRWSEIIKSANVKVDESGDGEMAASQATPQAAGPEQF